MRTLPIWISICVISTLILVWPNTAISTEQQISNFSDKIRNGNYEARIQGLAGLNSILASSNQTLQELEKFDLAISYSPRDTNKFFELIRDTAPAVRVDYDGRMFELYKMGEKGRNELRDNAKSSLKTAKAEIAPYLSNLIRGLNISEIQSFDEQTDALYSNAITALGEIGLGIKDSEYLLNILYDSPPEVTLDEKEVHTACESVLIHAGSKVLPLIIGRLSESDNAAFSFRASRIINGISHSDKDIEIAIPTLLELLKSEHSYTRFHAIQALGNLDKRYCGQYPISEALTDAFYTEQEGYGKTEILLSIIQISDNKKDAIPILIDSLDDENGGNASFKQIAISYLGNIGEASAPAIPNLLPLALYDTTDMWWKKGYPYIRKEARWAIWRILFMNVMIKAGVEKESAETVFDDWIYRLYKAFDPYEYADYPADYPTGGSCSLR